mmetsp:Transcript_27906/g.72214  ORF Transcript_27906/g.72214 Transcript_27906/m.72214 type:complete len:301 (-) Transcript_27906:64-966(-)
MVTARPSLRRWRRARRSSSTASIPSRSRRSTACSVQARTSSMPLAFSDQISGPRRMARTSLSMSESSRRKARLLDFGNLSSASGSHKYLFKNSICRPTVWIHRSGSGLDCTRSSMSPSGTSTTNFLKAPRILPTRSTPSSTSESSSISVGTRRKAGGGGLGRNEEGREEGRDDCADGDGDWRLDACEGDRGKPTGSARSSPTTVTAMTVRAGLESAALATESPRDGGSTFTTHPDTAPAGSAEGSLRASSSAGAGCAASGGSGSGTMAAWSRRKMRACSQATSAFGLSWRAMNPAVSLSA